MNVTHSVYCSLSPYKADEVLASLHPLACSDGRYVQRQITVLLYPDGLEVSLASVAAGAARDGWSAVSPAERKAFKLDWQEGADDTQMLAYLVSNESEAVRNRTLKMVATLRSHHLRFKPVFDINPFEL